MAKKRLILESQLVAHDIQNWHKSNILSLLSLSRQISIIGTDYSKQKIVLDVIVNTYDRIYFAHTLDLQGWDIARSDDKQSQYYGDRSYFNEAITNKKISFQTLRNSTTKKTVLCLANPTFQSTKIVGLTSICTNFNAITQRLSELKLGKTAYGFVVDKKGNLLIPLNAELLSKNNLININQYPPVENILAGNQGYFSFTDNNRIRWASHSIRLNNGWTLVIQQKETELFAQKIQLQNLSLFMSGGIIVLIIGLTFWFTNNSVAAKNKLSSDVIILN